MMKDRIRKAISVFILIVGVGCIQNTYSQVSEEWYETNKKEIDSIRKGDFVIQIVDDMGAPLDATVSFKLTRHEFPWGTAIDLTGDDTWYTAAANKYFNYAVPENVFKWSSMQPTSGPVNYSRVNGYLDWCDELDWEMRGHTLLWGSTSYEDTHPLQKWVKDLPLKPDMWDTCKVRVQREMSYYKGIIKEYDVLNEATPGHADWLQENIGDSINWYCFKWADEIDPDADLYINDYGMISGGDFYLNYMNTIQKMLDNGAPLDGIGVQGHFGRAVSPTGMKTALDSLSTFGLPIRITEFDMDVGAYNLTEEVQAKYYSLAMRTAFAHPSVSGFLFWGFWDARHWRDEAGIFATNKAPKIAADSVYHLLYNEWATNETISTTSGAIDLNAFLGTYDLVANVDGVEKYFTTTLLKDQSDTVKISFNNGLIPPPAIDSVAVYENDEVRLYFDQKMITTGLELNEFIVIKGSKLSVQSISQPEDDSTQIILNVGSNLNSLSTVSVIYNSGTLKSALGGVLQPFGPEYARNNLPGFVRGFTHEDGSIVSVVFSQGISQEGIEENTTAFKLVVDDVEIAINDIEVDPTDATTVNLIPAEEILVNTTVKVAYSPGTIRSSAGGSLPEFGLKLVMNNVTTGVDGLNQNFNIYGFFNSKNKEIEITNLDNELNFNYSLISSSGSILQAGRITDGSNQLDVSSFATGVYILQFTSGNDMKTKVQKILIY